MWCVRKMGQTSCLCFPQISKCLISRCAALIHNSKAKCGSVTCRESCLLLHLLSPHLVYLTRLLFSLYHSTMLHGPNSAPSSCLAQSSCNSSFSPPVQFLLCWPPLYCEAVKGVRGLHDHWEHRLYALRPKRELGSLALSAARRVWGEKALPKAKSSQWTVNRSKSLKLRFFFFLLAKFVRAATGWETIWLLSKIKNIILLK